ncbi:MAG: hypothetical protein FWD27_08115 [Coriobacteriia bacterium]|nr:hypothetical protein [Coriobacteriia bacterium]
MDSSKQNIQPEGFDTNRVSYLLDSAALAEQGGNSRLAIHLYCAAFEASQESGSGVDERALSGLRHAWNLACEQGDRSTAETIFNDLAPYNSDEQTRSALAELQEMATQQLGLSKEEMEEMAMAFVDEIRDAGINITALTDRFNPAGNSLANPLQFDELAASLTESLVEPPNTSTENDDRHDMPTAGEAQVANGSEGERPNLEVYPDLRYIDLVGFERAKEKMRIFGIVDPRDTEMNSFLQQAESFHGFSGPVLTQNFLLVGSSREDCGLFAQATANEIGWPAITMIVDVNELGDGTIKVIAPVKRSLFGPPRLTDLPNPCTLIIQNIDILQDLFWNEEQAINRGQGSLGYRSTEEGSKPHGMGKQPGIPLGPNTQGQPHHSLQNEVLGYLGMLVARGGVFVIATSAQSSEENPLVLSEQLENLLGKPVEICVDAPDTNERHQVLKAFSEDHPSFHDLDTTGLAHLSEGMSRFEIVASCRQAVETAYSESLKNQRHQMVNLEDVLTQFTRCLAQDSMAYRLVEDYLVTLFTAKLENDLLQTDVIPHQISLDLDNSDSS